MKIALKRFVTSIVIAQSLAIPVMSAVTFAAAPKENTPGMLQGIVTPGTAMQYSSNQNEPYFTDMYGNILMNVNIWGFVTKSGSIAVPEGSDIVTALSLAGGPSNKANLEKVRINRSMPDENGKMTYVLNLEKYVKKGDRSMLFELRPNDTIIVPEDKSIDILSLLGVAAAGATIYSVVNQN
jgi:hypothetical protein